MLVFGPLFLLLLTGLSANVVGYEVNVYFDSHQSRHRDHGWTNHPEHPARIAVCVDAIRPLQINQQQLRLIDIAPLADSADEDQIYHQPVTDQELIYARSLLLQTHNPKLLTNLEEKTEACKKQRAAEGKGALGHMGNIDGDTYLTTETLDVCLRATAAWIRAVDTQNSVGFALTRPPGHHATYNLQNGFCLFNFAAAAALHCANNGQRVAVLDWDVHYGQGVADIVRRHPSQSGQPANNNTIRYVSLHQVPAFPYEGERLAQDDQVLTIPLQPDTTWACGYEEKFHQAVEYLTEWDPDIVLVCAGYDALSSDDLASMSLNADDYEKMTHLLIENFPDARIAFGLEGGYQLDDVGPTGNLGDAFAKTVRAFLSMKQ